MIDWMVINYSFIICLTESGMFVLKKDDDDQIALVCLVVFSGSIL